MHASSLHLPASLPPQPPSHPSPACREQSKPLPSRVCTPACAPGEGAGTGDNRGLFCHQELWRKRGGGRSLGREWPL